MKTSPDLRLSHVLVSHLHRELRRSKAFAAGLKRDAGSPLSAARSLVPWYGFLERSRITIPSERYSENAFMVATLAALDRASYRRAASDDDPDVPEEPETPSLPVHPAGRTFGTSLREIVQRESVEDDPVARRFAMIVDSELGAGPSGSLPRHLTHAVRLIVSRRNRSPSPQESRRRWARLLDDLNMWNHKDRRVQRDWVRDFFSIHLAEQTPAENLDTEERGPDAD